MYIHLVMQTYILLISIAYLNFIYGTFLTLTNLQRALNIKETYLKGISLYDKPQNTQPTIPHPHKPV